MVWSTSPSQQSLVLSVLAQQTPLDMLREVSGYIQRCQSIFQDIELLVLHQGDYGTFCQSHNLDNLEKVDYDNGMTAFFDGAPDDDGDDDGMGECKGADLNYGLNGGTATWTGEGTWTGTSSSPVCIKFYDPDNNKPTCCCDLADTTLEQVRMIFVNTSIALMPMYVIL